MFYSSGWKIYRYTFSDSKSVLLAEFASQPFVYQQTLYAIEQGSVNKIVKMTLDGANRQTILASESYTGPIHKYMFDNIQVSPDGKYIAYEGDAVHNPHTYVVTNDNDPELVVSIGDYESKQPMISPTWDRQGNLYVQGSRSMNNGIYKVNSEFTTMERFDPELSNVEQPMVSPDGTKMAFIKDAKLYSINIDGTNLVEYLIDEAEINRPFWSPDSKFIAFNSKGRIFTIDINTFVYRQVPNLSVNRGNQVVWTN